MGGGRWEGGGGWEHTTTPVAACKVYIFKTFILFYMGFIVIMLTFPETYAHQICIMCEYSYGCHNFLDNVIR